MKIFNNTKNWEEKVNFVDENNVLVGYDLSQDCCEQADWTISDSEILTNSEVNNTNQVLPDEQDWRFDPDFFEETSPENIVESGGVATFRLVNSKGEQKFLHLFNCHNGYYSHGFTMEKNGKNFRQGSL